MKTGARPRSRSDRSSPSAASWPCSSGHRCCRPRNLGRSIGKLSAVLTASGRTWLRPSRGRYHQYLPCETVFPVTPSHSSIPTTNSPTDPTHPMSMKLITAGESHGPGLTCIVEGLPAGLQLEREALDRDLARRQLGHGRGGRMKIETDRADVTAGVRHGRTLGGPIAIQVHNRDYANWEERMNPWPVEARDARGAPAAPRPRGPRRHAEVRAERRARHPRARERPRDRRARGGRRRRQGVPAGARRRGLLARAADHLGQRRRVATT